MFRVRKVALDGSSLGLLSMVVLTPEEGIVSREQVTEAQARQWACCGSRNEQLVFVVETDLGRETAFYINGTDVTTAFLGPMKSNTILMPRDIPQIRRLAKKGTLSHREIAQRYGVTIHTIRAVLYHQAWTWVEGISA